MSRRQMKPWEVIATLLSSNQIRLMIVDALTGADRDDLSTFRSIATARPVLICPRTGKEITLDNVKTIQVEHWPIQHVHGGPVSPDNAVISLAEGHKEQTKREAKANAKAKRIVKKREGTFKRRGKPIQSRGFDKTLTKRFDGKVVAR